MDGRFSFRIRLNLRVGLSSADMLNMPWRQGRTDLLNSRPDLHVSEVRFGGGAQLLDALVPTLTPDDPDRSGRDGTAL
jgi:hypothetical protein